MLNAARGQPWIGHATIGRPTIFVGFEGGEAFLAQRILEVGHVSAMLPDERPALSSFSTGLEGYEWVVARLRQAVTVKEKWPVLIVIDTLSQVLACKGLDENDNMEVTNFLRDLDELVQQTDAVIVFIHHFAKYNFQMRGASAISALCNWCEINPVKGAEQGTIKLEWNLRHGVGGEDAVRIAKPNGRFEFEVLDLQSLPQEARSARVQEAVLALLKSRAPRYVPVADLIAAAQAAGAKIKSERAMGNLLREMAVDRRISIAAGIGPDKGTYRCDP